MVELHLELPAPIELRLWRPKGRPRQLVLLARKSVDLAKDVVVHGRLLWVRGPRRANGKLSDQLSSMCCGVPAGSRSRRLARTGAHHWASHGDPGGPRNTT